MMRTSSKTAALKEGLTDAFDGDVLDGGVVDALADF